MCDVCVGSLGIRCPVVPSCPNSCPRPFPRPYPIVLSASSDRPGARPAGQASWCESVVQMVCYVLCVIYAIRAVGSEYVKIGISTKSGMGRIADMQTGCPFELVLIAEADWPHSEERRIHAHLKRLGRHARGEWFQRGGETDKLIDLLRDGHTGLEAWIKRSRYSRRKWATTSRSHAR